MKKKKIIPYDPSLKVLARKLRAKGTKGEALLWKNLKAKQIEGYQFNRQKPLLRFIVDFYCAELGLVIEIDGSSHDRAQVSEKDACKEKALKAEGLQVLRFSETDVRYQIDDVMVKIRAYIEWFQKQ